MLDFLFLFGAAAISLQTMKKLSQIRLTGFDNVLGLLIYAFLDFILVYFILYPTQKLQIVPMSFGYGLYYGRGALIAMPIVALGSGVLGACWKKRVHPIHISVERETEQKNTQKGSDKHEG